MAGVKIVMTGAAGQLGTALVREFESEDVLGLIRADLDLTDHAAVRDVMTTERPDVIVNCAAYNDVDGAEDEAVRALDVNAFAVRSLARAADAVGATLVHYSTDFVFDGEATQPYVETDQPNPRSVYAVSKLIGEWFADDAPKAYVLRVESLFGGSRARGSIDHIIDAIVEGREVRVFTDRVVSPSYVVDVARATRVLIEGDAPAGLYHCVNSGHTSWFDLGQEIARQLCRDGRLVPVSVVDVPLRACRPKYCALSNAKLGRAGCGMPSWQDALARFLTARTARPGIR